MQKLLELKAKSLTALQKQAAASKATPAAPVAATKAPEPAPEVKKQLKQRFLKQKSGSEASYRSRKSPLLRLSLLLNLSQLSFHHPRQKLGMKNT